MQPADLFVSPLGSPKQIEQRLFTPSRPTGSLTILQVLLPCPDRSESVSVIVVIVFGPKTIREAACKCPALSGHAACCMQRMELPTLERRHLCV